MRTLKNILLIVIILLPLIGEACRAPIKMHKFLFKTDLIVKCKIVSHTDQYYKIEILDVYRDHEMEIKVGDFIKIKKEINVISSAEIVHRENIEAQLSGVAFLGKHKEGWGVIDFSFFYNDKVTLHFDYEYCRVEGTAEEVKAQIQEYFKEFHLTDGKVVGKKTEKEVVKSNLGQLALTQYYQLYMFTVNSKIRKRINCGDPIIEVAYEEIDLIYNPIVFEKSDYGLIFTSIKINGKVVKSMIDFGDPNVLQLSSSFVQNEHIKVSKSNAVAQDLFGNTFEINEGKVNEVLIGNWKSNAVHFASSPGEIESVAEQINTPFDAVIGWGYFEQYYFILDYRNNQIVLYNQKPTLQNLFVTTPYNKHSSYLSVPVKIQGKNENLIIDTGAPVSMIDSTYQSKQRMKNLRFEIGNKRFLIHPHIQDLTLLNQLNAIGIIGGDFLDVYKILIDPFKNELGVALAF